MRTRRYIKVKRSAYIESNTQKQKRLLSIIVLGMTIIVLAIVFFFQLGQKLNTPKSPSPSVPEQSTQDDITTKESIDSVPSETPKTPESQQPESSTRPSSAEGPFLVTYIADGDTIHINYYGFEMSLRLIGVDTPETVDERTPVQCFGIEASNYLKSRLTNQQVYIESDPTQSDTDIYGRLLRYVYLDNEDIGLSIIANGYGHEYTYYIPYQKQSEYQAAEEKAAKNGLGLWSPTTCAGITE